MYQSEPKKSKRIKIIDYEVNDIDKNLLKMNKLDLYKKAILSNWLKKKKISNSIKNE